MLPVEAGGLAFGVGAATSLATVPLATHIARRTGFLDKPTGYKEHGQPTPYLGGSAVLVAFLLAVFAFGDGAARFLPVVLGALALWAAGTTDDRITLTPLLRVAITVGAAVGLWAGGLGWDVFAGSAFDLLLTVIWVLGLVNAFNLMDNLDGATATVATTACLGAGAFAVHNADLALAGASFALGGACFGFLYFNLAKPARIFLGDGGSMPIGFIVAALAIAAQPVDDLGGSAILTAGLLVGLVILDTTLVIVSRRRRGVPLVTGGRDHLTHRLLRVAGSPRRVAGILAALQLSLCALAFGATHLGGAAVLWIGAGAVAAGIAAIVFMESHFDQRDVMICSSTSSLAAARSE